MHPQKINFIFGIHKPMTTNEVKTIRRMLWLNYYLSSAVWLMLVVLYICFFWRQKALSDTNSLYDMNGLCEQRAFANLYVQESMINKTMPLKQE